MEPFALRRRGERHRALRELHRRADQRRREAGFLFLENERLPMEQRIIASLGGNDGYCAFSAASMRSRAALAFLESGCPAPSTFTLPASARRKISSASFSFF